MKPRRAGYFYVRLQMNRTKLIGMGLAVIGLVSGPYALRSAQLAQPPLGWPDLAFIFAGSIVGIVLVLGFQALLRNPRAVRWGWLLFGANAAFFVGAGVSSLITSLVIGNGGPSSVMFLVIGVGISTGLVLCRYCFRSAFAT
jgi:hypothetical protein